MLKVKYPQTHGLDGKWHNLDIIKAKKYNGKVIIKCLDNGKLNIIEVARYAKTWYMIPIEAKDFLNHLIMMENDKLATDITDFIKKELDNTSITNKEEYFKQKETLTIYRDKRTNTYYIEIPDYHRIQGIIPSDELNIRNGKEVMENDSLSTIFHQVLFPTEYEYLISHYRVRLENLIIHKANKHR